MNKADESDCRHCPVYNAVAKERDAWKDIAETRGQNYTELKAQLAEALFKLDIAEKSLTNSPMIKHIERLERELAEARLIISGMTFSEGGEE